MPRGGARPNSGRKSRKNILPMPGVSLPPVRPSGPCPARPTGMTKAAIAIWERLAPHAHSRGTLTEHTADGFVLLCNAYVRMMEVAVIVDKDGYAVKTVSKKVGSRMIMRHPLASVLLDLISRTEQLMARYGLVPDGRAAGTKAPGANVPPINPWAEIVNE